MPTPELFKSPFYCGHHFHLVFKCIDGLVLFKNDLNKTFFLKRFSFYMKPVAGCFAYCLLDNHAHFIISIKTSESLRDSLTAVRDEIKTIAMKKFLAAVQNDQLVDDLIERQVNRFMVSYANAYNKMYARTGGLFQSPFRRSKIENESHLQQAIIYVHANAQKHGLVSDYRLYGHSSYHESLSGNSLFVQTAEVLIFFGDTKNFIEQHEKQVAQYYGRNWPDSKIEVD